MLVAHAEQDGVWLARRRHAWAWHEPWNAWPRSGRANSLWRRCQRSKAAGTAYRTDTCFRRAGFWPTGHLQRRHLRACRLDRMARIPGHRRPRGRTVLFGLTFAMTAEHRLSARPPHGVLLRRLPVRIRGHDKTACDAIKPDHLCLRPGPRRCGEAQRCTMSANGCCSSSTRRRMATRRTFTDKETANVSIRHSHSFGLGAGR
jgi:hypothetical protein